MKMAKYHFSKTEAITEAKRVYGMSFAQNVTLHHNGAFWILEHKTK